ncbi:hypothetical protein [Candidatus Protochlamydia phocaeensis]|uniref:hypothetical protein n=1 Tax=Candidatus Protochlamydia phocaeensis TaxID=1414722 RepID=UPI000838FEC8|nr:hypothetical protein [Candidatus Protochlamydia phocaeensis]
MLRKSVVKIATLALGLLALTMNAEAAIAQSNPSNSNQQAVNRSSLRKESDSTTQEKYDIMRRDEIDNTDTYAIPFDESEVEDEQQIDMDEKKDVFPLPHSH